MHRLSQQAFEPARRVQLLRRGQLFVEQIRVTAGASDRAALLVRADEQRDARVVLRGGLVAFQLVNQLFFRQPLAVRVLEIRPEQQHPAEVVLRDLRRHVRLGAADEKELPDLFLQRHIVQIRADLLVPPRVERLCLLFRRFLGRRLRRLLRRGAFGGLLFQRRDLILQRRQRVLLLRGKQLLRRRSGLTPAASGERQSKNQCDCKKV